MGHYNRSPTSHKCSFRHWLHTIFSLVLTMEAVLELDLLHQMGESFSFFSSPPFVSTATGWSLNVLHVSISPTRGSFDSTCILFRSVCTEAYVAGRELENVSFTTQALQVGCIRWFMSRLRFLEGNQIFSLCLSFAAQYHSFFSFPGQ